MERARAEPDRAAVNDHSHYWPRRQGPWTHEMFMERLEPEPNSGCWIWIAGRFGAGYGVVEIGGPAPTSAHRLSYRLFIGAIPTGAVVMHRCDLPSCVNPGHLKLGTIRDNNRDAKEKGRHAFGARNGRAKLTEEDVAAIRRLRESGHALRSIADVFGIAISTVSQISNGQRWV